jgi:hypothetical protein
MMITAGILVVAWISIQIAGAILLIWLSWRYFDRRYKSRDVQSSPDLLTGALERTSEVFIDPKDGLTYRVYYNRKTGDREYVQEAD